MTAKNIAEWTQKDVTKWLNDCGHEKFVDSFLYHEIDGKVLLTLKEDDLKLIAVNINKIGDIKKLYINVKQLQRDNMAVLFELGCVDIFPTPNFYSHHKHEVSRNFYHLASEIPGARYWKQRLNQFRVDLCFIDKKLN